MKLLDTYVADIERQVEKGVAEFGAKAETLVVEPTHPDEPARVITVHQGLDNETLGSSHDS